MFMFSQGAGDEAPLGPLQGKETQSLAGSRPF